MEKSLLSILKAEDRIVTDIADSERMIAAFQKERAKVESIPFNCEAKVQELASFDRIIANYQRDIEEYRPKLASVRTELREYLMKFLK